MCGDKNIQETFKNRSWCPRCKKYYDIPANLPCPYCVKGTDDSLPVIVRSAADPEFYVCASCNSYGEELYSWCKECAPILVNPLNEVE